jgi:hypothetical protein
LTGRESLKRFLKTNPADAGCAETFRLLDSYVERELAFGDAPLAFPDIAVHLATCGPCTDDVRGVMAAVAGQID